MAAPIGPPGGARELRSRVAIQRRANTTTELGGTSGIWSTIIPSRRAFLRPFKPTRRGNAEEVIAARLQGTSIWDCWVRFDSLTATILPSDRLVDARALGPAGQFIRVFNIRFAEDLDQRGVWLFLQLDQGVADG